MTLTDMPMLSTFPARKVRVACDKCRLNVQYDRNGLLAAGGDRTLASLLDDIVRRHGCGRRLDRERVNIFDRCGARFSELAPFLRAVGRL
jgi:hypothetical protein